MNWRVHILVKNKYAVSTTHQSFVVYEVKWPTKMVFLEDKAVIDSIHYFYLLCEFSDMVEQKFSFFLVLLEVFQELV